MNRRNALATVTSAMFSICLNRAEASGRASVSDHADWVAQVLRRMQDMRPGMTRAALLLTFTTEGGLSKGLQRTFVSRDCSYFKVDVTFRAV
jgi:hypothetical protein